MKTGEKSMITTFGLQHHPFFRVERGFAMGA
jgi:hypothetical protein